MKKITTCLLVLIAICTPCYAGVPISKDIKHQIQKRLDGGYTITLTGSIRHLSPITAEGAFPKQEVNYQIELKGNGKDWTSRNQPGFYYSYPENIECKTPRWDIGYAWVDKDLKTIYLNFYWIKSPDSLDEAVINGAYKIE